jgi:VanZ family protein
MSTALDSKLRRAWLYAYLLPGFIFWIPLLVSMYFAFTSQQYAVTDSYSDVILHAFAFIFLTASLGFSYFRRGAFYWPAVWMLIYAVFIECVQYFIPTRSFELGDIAVDVAAIAAGLILFYTIINPLLNKLQRRDRKSSD